MKEILLSAKELCKSFASNGRQNHVLNDVNVEIYKGDFTIVMGASGSGKSTLLYCLSGMDKITSGEVFYQGKRISSYKEKQMSVLRAREFGFVFQQIHLVSNLTLFENVAVPGYLDKEKSGKEVRERAISLLSQVHLEEAMDRLPSQVSGGEAQRGAIARAMISQPELLFADEPTGALNRKNTEDVLNMLSQLHGKGQSILMVTHDIRAALRATRLIYLADGRIAGEMTLPEFSNEDIKKREVQVQAWLTSMEW